MLVGLKLRRNQVLLILHLLILEPSIIRQHSPWSCLTSTRDAIEALFAAYNVFAEYKPFFCAFGTKSNEDERVQDGYQVLFSTNRAEVSLALVNRELRCQDMEEAECLSMGKLSDQFP